MCSAIIIINDAGKSRSERLGQFSDKTSRLQNSVFSWLWKHLKRWPLLSAAVIVQTHREQGCFYRRQSDAAAQPVPVLVMMPSRRHMREHHPSPNRQQRFITTKRTIISKFSGGFTLTYPLTVFPLFLFCNFAFVSTAVRRQSE